MQQVFQKPPEKKMKKIILATMLLLAVSLAVMPVSAVIQEQHFKGQVSVIDAAKNTMTVQVNYVYEGTEWVPYSKATTIPSNIIRGKTDNPLIQKELKQGDAVEACLMGDTDGSGEWIAMGKIGSVSSTETPLITLYGDPSKLFSDFYQGYVLRYSTVAQCESCTGTVCPSEAAFVIVSKDGEIIEEKEMAPGETYVFGKDTENQYVLQVTYNFGQTSSQECSSAPMMVGPQPINDFTIYDTQRSAILESMTATPTATPAQAMVTEATPVPPEPRDPPVTTAPTPSPMPTKSGLGFELIIIAGIIGSAIAVLRRY